MSDNKERFSECCRLVVTTEWWASSVGQNHRAKPGQLVCAGCGKGYDATPEEYAAVLAVDKAWNEANR